MKKIINTIVNKTLNKVPPIWMMRQAGRYLPEYQKVRSDVGNFLDLCYNPKLASEVTIQPIKRFDFDAAIIFSDILVIPDALGVDVDFIKGEGPKLSVTRNKDDLKKLSNSNLKKYLEPVFENIHLTKLSLPKKTALIGFSGCPWTLACYMVEGGGSKNFSLTRELALNDKVFFNDLIDLLTDAVIKYCLEQIKSGADIIKLFDSWAGILPPSEIDLWVLKPIKKITSALKQEYPNIPIIAFPRGVGTSYSDFNQLDDLDVVAIDQNTDLKYCKNILDKKIIQGNLDNFTLAFGSEDQIRVAVNHILEELEERPYIFNLGHGVLPQTPIKNIELLLKLIRD